MLDNPEVKGLRPLDTSDVAFNSHALIVSTLSVRDNSNHG